MYKEFFVSFHKGLNTKLSPIFIEDGECSIAQDCYFDEVGNIYSRKFLQKINEYNSEIKTIFNSTNGVLLVHLNDGDLYDDTSLISSSLGSDKFSIVEYNDVIHLMNGLYSKRYTASSGLEDMGNEKPSTDPTVSVSNQEIDDCNTNWAASANVTSAVDEHDYQTNLDDSTDISSIKLTIASAFGTGVVAYNDFTSLDLSSYTHVGFWIKSNADVDSGVLQLLLDNTSGCVSPLETLDIPALSINQWTHVVLELSDPSALTAVISVGINADSDPGAITVKIDDILACVEGNLDGAYYYKYTYVDSNGKESLPSDASGVANTKEEQASIVVTASSDSKISYINLYRLGGTLTDYYYVTQVANSTQTITDNVADGSLSTLMGASNNFAPPSGLRFIIEHYERLVGAKTTNYPNSILFTEAYQPEYWGTAALSNQFLISNSDPCKNILSWGRYVIFFKKNAIYVIEGSNPLTWHIRKSDSKFGNISDWSVQFFQMPMFISWLGLYSFDGNREIYLSDKIKSFFRGNKSYLYNSISAIYDNKYFLSIPGISKVMIYDFLTKIFYKYSLKLTELYYDEFNDILYGGDANNNLVRLEQNKNNDAYDSVSFDIKSKAYPLNDVLGKYGNLRNIQFSINTKYEDVTLEIYIDDELRQSLTINTTSMQQVRRSIIAAGKGKYAEFRFTYSGARQIEIQQPIIINPKDGYE